MRSSKELFVFCLKYSVHIKWSVIHNNWVIYMQRHLPSALKSTFRQLVIGIHGYHGNMVWISHDVTIFTWFNNMILIIQSNSVFRWNSRVKYGDMADRKNRRLGLCDHENKSPWDQFPSHKFCVHYCLDGEAKCTNAFIWKAMMVIAFSL